MQVLSVQQVGTTVGARMGRPEKAKDRKMKPQLHGLFPISAEKHIGKNLKKAMEEETIRISLGNRYCVSCNITQYEIYCRDCNKETILRGKCANPRCRASMDEGPCDVCGSRVIFTTYFDISMEDLIDKTHKRLGHLGNSNVKLKDVIKNPTGTPELLDKGILRSRYDLNVFRDGTIRMTV